MRVINSVADLGLTKKSRLLFVMPHPDDEAVFCSGLIAACTHLGLQVRVVTCTAGEASTLRHGLATDADLAVVRRKELQTALQILHVNSEANWNLPDGKLEFFSPQLKRLITKELATFLPTDVFCLEPDGIYGHPDHIALTKIVESIARQQCRLWYVTVAPWYQFSTARHMAKKAIIQPITSEFQLQLWWWQVWLKFLALSAHRSQFRLLPWQGNTFSHFLKNGIWTNEFFTRGN